MPICYEQQLKRSLEQGSPKGVYLIFGDDPYLKKQYVDKITDKTADKDDFFNYHSFDENADLQEVYDALQQLPMMADKKLVLLCDYDFEQAKGNEFERLCQLLSERIDTAVFVLWFSALEFDKDSEMAKQLISATEKSGGMAVCIGHRDASDLIRMLTAGAAKRGCKMSADTARYLMECVSTDISTLRNELEKLCAFANKGVIDNKAIDTVCVKTVEASVYDLTKEIFACNAKGAFKLVDELFYMRIAPQIILYSVHSAYVDMYRVYAATQAGVPLTAIAEEFAYGKREFVLRRAKEQLRRFDEARLRLSFEELLSCDRLLKSFGVNERFAIEQLIIRLIYIIQKGERID